MILITEKYRQVCFLMSWVLALYLLNYSVDPPHPFYPDNASHVESQSHVASFAEFLLEEVFGSEDPFEDFDAHANGDGDFANAFEFCCASRPLVNNLVFDLSKLKYPKVSPYFFPSPIMGILLPPPKSVTV